VPAYDIIGDVHGQADLLVTLLRKLGYEERSGAFRHPERQAIFVGDFIDRGPKQLETVNLARRMIDAGSARAVMGNHEFNAIAWFLPHPDQPGDFLRTHRGAKGQKNRKQHEEFLAVVGDNRQLHRELVDWFFELPLWLDLPGVRIVHACWHPGFMARLGPMLAPGERLDEAIMPAVTREPAREEEQDSPDFSPFKAADAITKGMEVPLPDGVHYSDKEGVRRNRMRVTWWNPAATTLRAAAFPQAGYFRLGGDGVRDLPETPVPPHKVFGLNSGPPRAAGRGGGLRGLQRRPWRTPLRLSVGRGSSPPGGSLLLGRDVATLKSKWTSGTDEFL
jgi:hypothetical protein